MVDDKKGKLGMGLQGLLGMQKLGNNVQNNSLVREIDILQIAQCSNQPRKSFDNDELMNLAESIKLYGILQPIIVQQVGDIYEIIAGERRYRAAKYANLSVIPCIVKDSNEIHPFTIAMIENIQRSNLDLVDEASGYLFLQNSLDLSQNEIAMRVGKSRSHIANMLRIANLSEDLKLYIKENNIQYGHLKVIASHPDVHNLVRICAEENLTVRQVENLVKSGDCNTVLPSKIENLSQKMPEKTEISQEVKASLKRMENDASRLLNMNVRFAISAKKTNTDVAILSSDLETLHEILERLQKK